MRAPSSKTRSLAGFLLTAIALCPVGAHYLHAVRELAPAGYLKTTNPHTEKLLSLAHVRDLSQELSKDVMALGRKRTTEERLHFIQTNVETDLEDLDRAAPGPEAEFGKFRESAAALLAHSLARENDEFFADFPTFEERADDFMKALDAATEVETSRLQAWEPEHAPSVAAAVTATAWPHLLTALLIILFFGSLTTASLAFAGAGPTPAAESVAADEISESVRAILTRAYAAAERSTDLATQLTKSLREVPRLLPDAGDAKSESDFADRPADRTGEAQLHSARENSRSLSTLAIKAKVLNDLAFQAKLLSFNVAVESARTGENNPAFGMLLGEIRNFAQQSTLLSTELHVEIDSLRGRTDAACAELIAGIRRQDGANPNERRPRGDFGRPVAERQAEFRHCILQARSKSAEIASIAQALSIELHCELSSLGINSLTESNLPTEEPTLARVYDFERAEKYDFAEIAESDRLAVSGGTGAISISTQSDEDGDPQL